jgi:phosphoribosylformylglycinamidine (FGAM) synthase-like amidotransferase family enzyme
MMPHPENLIEPLHGGEGGRALFAGIAEAVEAVA